jgi:crotonobetainyl-CoA:carnitine CoA-transferase CaiB-like acyl-CoA transferase
VSNESAGPLSGLKVVDCATLFAGPVVASLMADFGADVVKVEHPRGDPVRYMGPRDGDVSMWWAVLARNKRSVTLKLSDPRGAELLKQLLGDADVFIENFRPGTLERWGLGPDVLHELNPGLVIVRTTGFGQTGPYSTRPGFGTLAEAISGFAHINGWPDKLPSLLPLALGDHIAGYTGCFAVMFALWWREHGGEGAGQVIDNSIFEPLFSMLGPTAAAFDRFGIVPERVGNSSPLLTPRNTYQSSDGKWLALSASSPSIARRVMILVGRQDLADEPWFEDTTSRAEHSEEIDEAVGTWIAERTLEETLEAFDKAEGAIAPVYSIADIFADPHYQAREAITEFDDPRLGKVRLQNIVPRMDKTPGKIEHLGPELGAHNEDVYVSDIGLTPEELVALEEQGIV